LSEEIQEVEEPLERWLNTHWAGVENVRVERGNAQSAGSGFSATTLILPVCYRQEGRERQDRIVLRTEPPERAMYPQQAPCLDVEIEIQYKAMEAIRDHSKVPLAPLIGYESDPSPLGAAFFVMGFVDGVVPIEHPIYTSEGFFVAAQPEQRTQMLEDGLRVLADLHTIDWQAAGLDWLVDQAPGTATQLVIWQSYIERELDGRRQPVLEAALAWLHANLPQDSPVGLCWGDARPGNMIWQDFRCACVCDFENVYIGPPELDLAWWLMFDRYAHETQGIARLPGEPTREEQREFYAKCAGREIGDTTAYEVFAAVRYAALVVRVMNRMVARGQLPKEQELWLKNPVADMLARLMENISR